MATQSHPAGSKLDTSASKQKSEQKKLHRQSTQINSHKEPTADEAEIFDETAHIPDRDQMFGVDHKTFPPNPDALYNDSWSDDANERVSDDRNSGKDYYNAMKDLGGIHRPVGPTPNRNETPTAVERAEDFDQIEALNDKKLKLLADAMGIPGRKSMNRHQLIEALRSSGGIH